ncbi:excisionase family DNA-binding protein [Hansschlegelia sp.]|uniref:excisionase family DNA-binding protein n=1 Tax=Hansschlegelia sp. TaxID=2041892 RepID=UPI0039C8943B
MPRQTKETPASAGSEPQVEPLLTIQEAARRLGVHDWALRRAVKSGAVPAYAPFNSRKLVRLSEVLGVIQASRI